MTGRAAGTVTPPAGPTDAVGPMHGGAPVTTPSTRIELFADILCPFTHVGLRRFVDHRAGAGRTDVGLWVRAWPLEVVNGQPLDAGFIAEEIDEIHEQVAPDLFTTFDRGAFPSSSLPALALARAAYRRSPAAGEAVSLELRNLLRGGRGHRRPRRCWPGWATTRRRGRCRRRPWRADRPRGGRAARRHRVAALLHRRWFVLLPRPQHGARSGRAPPHHRDPEGFESFLARCFA